MNGQDIVTIFHKVDGPCELTALDAVDALRHLAISATWK